MNYRNLEGIVEYYEELDRKTLFIYDKGMKTKKGKFVPTKLREINPCIEYLIREGVINPSGLFLDAGCGDARLVILMNGVYGLPSIGVEYDEQLCLRGEEHIQRVQELNFLSRALIAISQGDFGECEPYRRLGVSFTDIATILNFVNNSGTITNKILKESNKDTVFILETPDEKPPNYDGLRYERPVIINPSGDWGRFLHVYRKDVALHHPI